MSQGWFPLEAPEENLFPGPLQSLEAPASLGSWPHHRNLHFHHHSSDSDLLPPTTKDPCDDTGPPTQIILQNLFISRSQCNLICQVPFATDGHTSTGSRNNQHGDALGGCYRPTAGRNPSMTEQSLKATPPPPPGAFPPSHGKLVQPVARQCGSSFHNL